METFYYMNPSKGTIVCRIVCREGVFVGTAKCNPTDKWDDKFGRDLAHDRAEIKLKKQDLKELELEVEKAEHILSKRKKNLQNLKDEIDNISDRVLKAKKD